jgi:LPS-assembly lipoprotein
MTKLRAHALASAAVFGLAAVTLSGCGGFTPLYAVPGVSPKLAAIEVSRPDGRTGFLMGQFLDDEFARDRASPPLYRLILQTHEERIPRGIRVDNVASRYEVDLNTVYTLVDLKTRSTVTSGLVKVVITYTGADQPYAGIAGEQEGQQRAAEQSAARIRLELASFFAAPRPMLAASALVPGQDATYSERLQAAAVQSPRQRALGEPSVQNGQNDMISQPLQSTTAPGEEPKAFSPSQDPTNGQVDPYAVKSLPTQ